MRFLLLLFIFSAAPAFAADSSPLIKDGDPRPPKQLPEPMRQEPREQPWPVRLLLHEVPLGMFIELPIVDTNPNKGTTYGVMPILVVQQGPEKKIGHILAPSLTYNPVFKTEATMRYYWYPNDRANYFARAALSGTRNQDVIGEMEDLDFLGRGLAVSAKVVYDVDGSKRFFGVGPDTHESAETNFTRKTIGYYWRMGLPFFKGSGWKFNIAHHMAGEKIADGVVNSLPDIAPRFPRNAPAHHHQDSELQLFIDYDTRDSAVTTSKGSYLKFLIENAQRPLGSEFAFQRYGIDMRRFQPWDGFPTTSAARVRYEQLQGEAPFYLLSSMGGKETLRAYGEGRFIDRGMLLASFEQRLVAFKAAVTGVAVELEIAPFIEAGTVFDTPGRMAARYVRPAYGTAIRAVARPQVVGSIDLGFGQEGLSVFMDVNYSF